MFKCRDLFDCQRCIAQGRGMSEQCKCKKDNNCKAIEYANTTVLSLRFRKKMQNNEEKGDELTYLA